jgi:CheY-like chemotaxis protein
MKRRDFQILYVDGDAPLWMGDSAASNTTTRPPRGLIRLSSSADALAYLRSCFGDVSFRTDEIPPVPNSDASGATNYGETPPIQPLHDRQRRPDLILLNLPIDDRAGLLAALKGNEMFRRIPVVVLGSAGAAGEVRTAYDCFANCFVTKPETPEQFFRVIQALEEFWFTVAKLPAT